MRDVIVNLEALNQVVKYLSERPYKEVVMLLDQLKTTVRELPDGEEKTKEEKPETERSKPKGFTNPQ